MKRNAFTLVELLVVISIIAVLATIGLTIYSGAQKSARIAKRVEDLRNIKVALEIYYSRNNVYPTTTGSWGSECSGNASDQVVPGLIPTYMAAFPADPFMNRTAGTSCYRYRSDGTDYKLQNYNIPTTEMSSTDFRSQPNLIDPARDSGLDCSRVESGTVTAWAIYSNNTDVNDAITNPACWN